MFSAIKKKKNLVQYRKAIKEKKKEKKKKEIKPAHSWW